MYIHVVRRRHVGQHPHVKKHKLRQRVNRHHHRFAHGHVNLVHHTRTTKSAPVKRVAGHKKTHHVIHVKHPRKRRVHILAGHHHHRRHGYHLKHSRKRRAHTLAGHHRRHGYHLKHPRKRGYHEHHKSGYHEHRRKGLHHPHRGSHSHRAHHTRRRK